MEKSFDKHSITHIYEKINIELQIYHSHDSHLMILCRDDADFM